MSAKDGNSPFGVKIDLCFRKLILFTNGLTVYGTRLTVITNTLENQRIAIDSFPISYNVRRINRSNSHFAKWRIPKGLKLNNPV